MFMTRRIWCIISAATVMLAVQFAAVAAEAHAGHARGLESMHMHHGSIHAVAVNAQRGHDIAPKSEATVSAENVQHVSVDRLSTASAPELLSKIVDPSGCATGCCSDCMACFGFAFGESPQDLSPAKRSVRMRLPNLLASSEIKPEALRKPPRNVV